MSRDFANRDTTPDAASRAVNAPKAESPKTLPANVQADFGERYGFDFSRVGIHDGTSAAETAAAHRAHAVTYGQDVMFAPGRYAPGTSEGDSLLAHELAHVVQQSRGGGMPAAEAEKRADAGATQALHGGHVSPQALGGSPLGPQSKPEDAPLVVPPVGPAAANVDIEANDTIGRTHPGIVQLAQSYKANTGMRISLSANLSEDVKNSSERERAERSRLGSRMRDVADALKALGVPATAIDISPATAYSRSARGQISGTVGTRAGLPPALTPPPMQTPPPFMQQPNIPPPPATALPDLNLEFTFGPVTVKLPKEVRAKLPIPIRGATKLVIDLNATAPGKFSLQIKLDGTPYLRVSVKAGAELDTKNSSVTGSAALIIETAATVCDSPDPNETREKLRVAGEKLNKAVQEYETATDDDKTSKAFDIAGALGEIYEAVDKAKAKCTDKPRATLEFGYKRLLTPGSETDPSKLPPTDYVGVTGTFRF